MGYDALQAVYGDNMALRQQRDMKQAVLASLGAGNYADDRLGLAQLPFNSGGFGISDGMDNNSMINTMKAFYALKAMDAQYSDVDNTRVAESHSDIVLADTVEADETKESSSSSDSSKSESKSTPVSTKEENKAAVEKAEEEYKKARNDFKDETDRKGWIGGLWDGIKNTVGASSERVKKEEIEPNGGGIGHSFRKLVSKVIDSDNGSDAIQKKLDDTKSAIEAAKKDPKKVDELFAKTSSKVDMAEDIYIKGKKGEKLSEEEQALYDSVKKELDGKTSATDVRKAIAKVATKENSAAAMINDSEEGSMSVSQKAKDYKSSQAAGVDMTTSIATGLIVAGGIALTPFTGGASLAAAIAAGAAIKVSLKASDTIGSSKSYSLGDFGSDAFSGSIDGLFAGIVPGAGSAATTGAAKVLGLQAVKTTTKEIGVEGAEAAAKAAGKELIAKEVGKDAVYIAKDGVVKQASKKFWGGYTRKEIGSFAKEGSGYVAKVGEKELGHVATDAAKGTVKVSEKAGIRSSFSLKAPKGQSSSIEYMANPEAKWLGGLLNKVDKTGAVRVFAAKTASGSMVGGTMGSTYSVADGVVRGEDAETIMSNAGTAFKVGAAFGGVAHVGGSALSKGTSKVRGSLAARAESKAEAAAFKKANPIEHKEIVDGKLVTRNVSEEEAKTLLYNLRNTYSVAPTAELRDKLNAQISHLEGQVKEISYTFTKKDGNVVTSMLTRSEAEAKLASLQESTIGLSKGSQTHKEIAGLQKQLDAIAKMETPFAPKTSQVKPPKKNTPAKAPAQPAAQAPAPKKSSKVSQPTIKVSANQVEFKGQAISIEDAKALYATKKAAYDAGNGSMQDVIALSDALKAKGVDINAIGKEASVPAAAPASAPVSSAIRKPVSRTRTSPAKAQTPAKAPTTAQSYDYVQAAKQDPAKFNEWFDKNHTYHNYADHQKYLSYPSYAAFYEQLRKEFLQNIKEGKAPQEAWAIAKQLPSPPSPIFIQ